MFESFLMKSLVSSNLSASGGVGGSGGQGKGEYWCSTVQGRVQYTVVQYSTGY